MRGLCYQNTKTNLPGWREQIHQTQKYGYAYETDTHFVHFYGRDTLNIISVGLTVLEKKQGNLQDWVVNNFGAQNIENMDLEIGHTIDGIWRPCLYFQDEIYVGLNVTKYEQRSTEQALRLLISKLDDILEYIEPNGPGLDAFSHKTRELLILACTEVENQWMALLKKGNSTPINGRMFTTQDYVKLNSVAFLNEFNIEMRNYNTVNVLKPFDHWESTNPTTSLIWYDAYNKTKHDRDNEFSSASLKNVLDAVAANIILFCVRFSPISLLNETKTLSTIINQLFEIKMASSNHKSYYLPELNLPANIRSDRFLYDCYREKHNKTWIVDTLVV
jgi:hypothetical protein